MKTKILFVLGTRPEAIKLAPLYLHMRGHTLLEPLLCVTGQHREMVRQVTEFFSIRPDHDLDIMTAKQTLCGIATNVLANLEPILSVERPAMVIVQGDTSTAFVAALAAHYSCIRIAHVEAGLRTWNLCAPYPEEANRQCLSRLADLHFAPTNEAKENLLKERIDPSRVFVTGNTVIDALYRARTIIGADTAERRDGGMMTRVLVTLHRRENHARFEWIAGELLRLARTYPQLRFTFPVHRSPIVRDAIQSLRNSPTFALTDPLPYGDFLRAMLQADMIVSDSGGVQEEATALGKKVFLVRDATERPEAMATGHVQLVGGDGAKLFEAVSAVMADPDSLRALEPCHVYGDGRASERITGHLLRLLNAR